MDCDLLGVKKIYVDFVLYYDWLRCIICASRMQGWIQDLVIGSFVIESALVLVSTLTGWLYTKYTHKQRQKNE